MLEVCRAPGKNGMEKGGEELTSLDESKGQSKPTALKRLTV